MSELPADYVAEVCEGCGTEDATFAAQMTDSVSMDNLLLSCAYCTGALIHDWLHGDEIDVAGWEIRRLAPARTDGSQEGRTDG